MSDKKSENPMAFPVDSGNKQFPYQEGMTLRDYFAAAALAGILANPNYDSPVPGPEITAAWAYKEADAMLKEREK